MGRLEVEAGREIQFDHYSGEHTPVVLIHAWGVNGRCWDITLPALLGAGHEVVVFDQRCCGRSDRDFDDVSIAAGGRDIEAIAQATGLARPVLVGWSMGAAIAVEAAARLDDVSGLCLIAPPTPRYTQAEGYPYGASAELVADTFRALRDNRPDFLHALAEGVFRVDVGPNSIEWLWQMFMEAGPRSDETLADLGQIDHRELLPQLDVPTLVASGTQDGLLDRGIHQVCSDLLPKGRLVEFLRSGHAPFIEERAAFDRELLAFLSEPNELTEAVPSLDASASFS